MQMIHAQNPALGSKQGLLQIEAGGNWRVGDKTLMYSFQSVMGDRIEEREHNAQRFRLACEEHLLLPAYKQVEAISLRLLHEKAWSQREQAITLIGCERVS